MRNRINHLNALVKVYKERFKLTTFILEDGSPFITDLDPFQYLIEHRAQTPRGRIVAYPCDKKGADPITLAIYEEIENGIKNGGIDIPFDDCEIM